ncbi:TonB-dependent receptor plug domain-containing protein [Flavobacterium sp.]|uniref:TonB-dependent receptor n=1 Tax=Flavobacterium sp. TaxID=239 RepID=UPI003F69EC3F
MKIYYLLSFVLFSFLSSAQVVKGKVLDEFSVCLNDVYLFNTNSQTHSHTNEFGEFVLNNTKVNDVLKCYKLGYQTQEFTVVNIEKIEIILQSKSIQLDQIVLNGSLNTSSTVAKIDLLTNPVNSSQEILRKVPGLFIGQHAGGGKAEQIFLRGFDVDHGTDIALSVDGMPINNVSHAHGQGYSDLHFIIPETISKIDFDKGPYKANKGNFATAGYVAFSTIDKLDNNKISVDFGQFNTKRLMSMFNLLEANKRESAYIATEYISTDGPFDSPQNFNRLNLFGKYSNQVSNTSKFTIQASRFSSKWDASGQIPNRLVQNGSISRFGAVDDTEGGYTSRTNVIASSEKIIDDFTYIKSNVFYSNYDFTLFSNFTFFLNDPVNGDQIKQTESRNLYGGSSELNKKIYFKTFDLALQSGVGFRADNISDIELSRTLNRKTNLEQIQLGNVDEINMYGYFNSEFKFGKLKVAPAFRLDYFKFNYQDQLATLYANLNADVLKFSPKLNFIYAQNNAVEYFVKTGFGFHSNDSRVVLQQNKDMVPGVFGADVGAVFKPISNLFIQTALWTLHSQQEFVYVGDEGVVEASGKSRRYGLDLGFRYQLSDYVFIDFDGNYSHARTGTDFEEFIPLAPKFSSTGGITLKDYKRFSAAIKYRYLGDRAANEDNSVVAKGYFVSDLNLNYKISRLNIGLVIENIFNAEWNETQFLTESRLQNEPQSVEEIHFTPGTPFFSRLKVTYTF